MAVKSLVHQIRKDAGLTQADLAKAVGISRQAYTAVESGRSVPSTEVALRLAQKLQKSVEDIFWLDDSPERIIRAELVGEQKSVPPGTRMQIIPFGIRRLARPLQEGAIVSHTLNEADAITISSHGNREVDLKLINNTALKTPTLVLAGSDPSTSIIAHMIRDLGIRLIWIEAESMPALHALARGEIHIAGCDFRDRITGVYNLPLVKEIVPFPCTVIRFAVWRQGLMLPAGNPKSIKQFEDLARPNISIINREPGAGSRGLLNRLMWETGISVGDIHGYDKVVHGHLSTGETVAAGLADCGIGIEAAAKANDLDFLPLNDEPYDLVIPNHFLDMTAIQSLLKLLKSHSLHRQIEALGGYDIRSMGNPTSIEK
jgi:putative molybdopterin biosynthesis protein